jgi:hypothetical protein
MKIFTLGLVVVAWVGQTTRGQKRLIFPSDDEFRKGNFIGSAASSNTLSGIPQSITSLDYDDDPLPSGPTRPTSPPRPTTRSNRPARPTSRSDRPTSRPVRPTPRPARPVTSRPVRPTPRTSRPSFDYEDDIFGSSEAPLPSGPTRRPEQQRRPSRPRPVNPEPGVPREVLDSLILLTTPSPVSVTTPRENVNFRLKPDLSSFQPEPLFSLPHRLPNGLLVSSSLDILDQTKLFTNMDPNQEQFIKAPTLNAGALPLAFESTGTLNLFPPFNREP